MLVASPPCINVTVTTSPTGVVFQYGNSLAFTLDGFSRTDPFPVGSEQWFSGETHSIGPFFSGVQAADGATYVYDHISDGVNSFTQNNLVVSPTKAITYTVYYVRAWGSYAENHQFGGSVVADHVDYVDANGASYSKEGRNVTLTAIPDSGKYFAGWYDVTGANTASNTDNPRTVSWSLNAAKLAAYFANIPLVTVDTSPAGLQVTVDGASTSQALTYPMLPGTHTISTQSQSGAGGALMKFKFWGRDLNFDPGGPYSSPPQISFIVSSNDSNSPLHYTAYFTTQYQLTPFYSGIGGTFQLQPASASPNGFYDSGTMVTVVATPYSGFAFSGFTVDGAASGIGNGGTITMNAPHSITANFVQLITFADLTDVGIGVTQPVSATVVTGLPVTLNSQTPAVCSVSGTTVTSLTAGVCTIQVAQAGNATYAAAAPVSRSFNVVPNRLGTPAILMANGGGTSSVFLAAPGATWTATSNTAFLHLLTGSTTGTGNQLVVFTVDAFAGTGTRTGTLTVGGQTLSVNQVGTDFVETDPMLGLGASAQPALVSGGNMLPNGVAVDGSGNVYYTDPAFDPFSQGTGGILVWRPDGIGPRPLYNIYKPSAIAADRAGNVYYAGNDASHANFVGCAVRLGTECPPTQAGVLFYTGTVTTAGLGMDGAGNVYFSDSVSAIRKWSPLSQQITTLVSGLSNPGGLAVDLAGNVYYADPGNNAIQKWDSWTKAVSTVAPGVTQPAAVALDGSGNLYFSSQNLDRVMKWTASSRQVSTVVSSGVASARGLAADSAGNLFIADTNNHAIEELAQAFTTPTSVTEPGTGGSDKLTVLSAAVTPINQILTPVSDQSWLTVLPILNGTVNFSFAPNLTGAHRTAHINVLGQPALVSRLGTNITVTQTGWRLNKVAGDNQIALGTAFGAALQVISTDENGSPLAGKLITFMVVPGATGASAAFPQGTNAAVSTLADGTATAPTLIANSISGQFTVTASGGTLSQTFTLNVFASSQTISFVPIGNQVSSAAPFAVTATASSALPVSLSSLTPAVCTLNGSTVTLVAAGVCTIQANQAGNGTYAPAAPVNQTFQVEAKSLGTPAMLVGSAAATSSVVLTIPGSAWTATSNSPFLHVSSGSATGVGSALVVFNIDAFAGTGTRTGTLTIGSMTLTVTQAGTNFTAANPIVTLVSSGLNQPNGLAVDSQGNVYIADSGNNAVRKWTASSQQVSPLVSSGLSNPTGVAVDGLGNVYIADRANRQVKQWSPGTQQITVLASLANANSVAVDGNANVYWSAVDPAIQEWSAASPMVNAGEGNQVTTLLTAGLAGPVGIAADGTGNLYIADQNATSVLRWDASTRQLTQLASAGLTQVTGVGLDGSGNVYITDRNIHIANGSAIRKWSPVTQQLSTVPVPSGTLNGPQGVTADGNGNVYVADTYNNAIREVYNAFVDAGGFTKTSAAGSDSVTFLPANVSLTGALAPASDQSWLTIGTISNGVVNFSFTANTSGAPRTAHLTVLGQPIAVTQGSPSLSKTAGDNQSAYPGQAFATALQVTAFDASNNPLPGAGVTFTVVPGNSGAGGSFAATPSQPVVTLANGTATAPVLTANGAAGQFTVTAVTGSLTQTFTLTIAPLTPQTITFGVLADRPPAAAPFTVSATSSSGLAVSFASTTPPVCTVAVATVTIAGTTGTCTIRATQQGNSTYSAATPVDQSFLVASQKLGTNELSAGSAGGTFSVVLSNPGASWTATANNSFLHLSSGSASGTGNALIQFTVDSFAGTGTRSGTLTIAGLTLSVTQAGTNYVAANPVTTLVKGLSSPDALAVDGAGQVFISNQGSDPAPPVIQKWNPATQSLTDLVTTANGLNNPQGVALDGAGNLYITDSGKVFKWTASTQAVTTLASGLATPLGVAVDGGGNVFVALTYGQSIAKLTNPTPTTVVSGLLYPSGLALDVAGNIYLSANNETLQEWNGTTLTTPVTGVYAFGGVAVDGSGNLYAADSYTNSIEKWSPSTQQFTAVTAGLGSPTGVAVDSAGNVYFADTGNNSVSKVTFAFVASGGLTEPNTAGADSLPPVVPASTSLSGIFAPTSDQSWLTIGNVAGGVVNFSFTANPSHTARVAHITVLGTQITVTQSAASALGTVPVFTVGASPSGNSFTVDGATYTSTQTFNWLPASTHTIACTTSSGTGAQCTGWSDGGPVSHTVTAPSSSATYTASFVTSGTVVDTSFAQVSLSGSTTSPGCAAGSRDFTATVQVQNTSGATINNPTASLLTLTQGNTLVSQSWVPSASIAPNAIATGTFHITLANCNTFQLYFDLVGQ